MPEIPWGMKRPIEGSFETLVALKHFSQAERTKHASVPYLLLFVDPMHKTCIEPLQSSPLRNVQDATGKKSVILLRAASLFLRMQVAA